ncbi:lachesin-like isoform X2 [Babylonia areolata]|uniref:lachesin-like isoform X2 n=1 Tax=Babylonia areolata TaxID=304850 RepID=UPI003FD4A9D6
MRVVSLGCTLRHLHREFFLLGHVMLVAMVAAFTENGVTLDPDRPLFLPRPSNITFHRGDTAILPCAIDKVGTKTIIWRRASDPNPLTIGQLVYVNDERYSIQSVPERLEWNLRIKDVQPRDAGVYECQISSRHKLIHHVMLRVNKTERPERDRYVNFKKVQPPPPVHSKPAIFMEGTKFVEKGDSIHLICNASGARGPPENLDWFKDGIKITADGWRHITIDKFRVHNTRTLVSVLDKRYSDMRDAGTYVCRSSNLGVTSLKVHVLNAGSTNVRRTSATSSNSTLDSGQGRLSTTSHSRYVIALLVTCYYVTQVH